MAFTRGSCDYLVRLKPRIASLVFCLLEKGIEGLFVSDGRSWPVSRIDVVVREGEELSLNAMEKLFHTTCREVSPSDGFAEKSISSQD